VLQRGQRLVPFVSCDVDGDDDDDAGSGGGGGDDGVLE